MFEFLWVIHFSCLFKLVSCSPVLYSVGRRYFHVLFVIDYRVYGVVITASSLDAIFSFVSPYSMCVSFCRSCELPFDWQLISILYCSMLLSSSFSSSYSPSFVYVLLLSEPNSCMCIALCRVSLTYFLVILFMILKQRVFQWYWPWRVLLKFFVNIFPNIFLVYCVL